MNRQSLARHTAMAVFCSFLTMFADGIAYSQGNHLPREEVSFAYGTTSATTIYIKFSIDTSATKFLADPTQTLRQNSIAVPQSAEAPWREFADALRRLTNRQLGQSNDGRRRSGRVESLTYQIELRGFLGGIRVALGDVSNATTAAVADRVSLNSFLNDPVRTLRAKGVQIPVADERAWKQLADALIALQLAYAKPGARLDRQTSNNSESTAPIRTRIDPAGDKNARVDRPTRKTPTAGASATQDLATGRQPTLDRNALEQSLHAALAPNVMGYTFLLIKDGRVAAEGAGGLARNAAD